MDLGLVEGVPTGMTLRRGDAGVGSNPASASAQLEEHHHQHHRLRLDYESLVDNVEGFEMTNLDSTAESIGV